MAVEDEPLSYVERKAKVLVMHPKYQGTYQDKALKTFAKLDKLMKKFEKKTGIKNYNPMWSTDSAFIAKATNIFDEWYSSDIENMYDIALLKLDQPIEFQGNIMPICLPQDDNDFEGKSAWVTGWGYLGMYVVCTLYPNCSLGLKSIIKSYLQRRESVQDPLYSEKLTSR